MNEDFKLFDKITGYEDIKIGVLKKYVTGEILQDGVYTKVQILRRFFYLYFETKGGPYYWEDELSDFLSMDQNEYTKLLSQYGSFFQDEGRTLFCAKEDAMSALDLLSDKMVLNKLGGYKPKPLPYEDYDENEDYDEDYSQNKYSDSDGHLRIRDIFN